MITTDIDYPAELPYPQRTGYNTQTVQPFIRTQLTSGRARQRRRFSSVPSDYTVNWIFSSNNEVALFEAWFRYKVNDGAAWFNCKLKTPLGLGDYVCRFTEMYDGPTPVGLCAWSVSARIEMWERPLIDAGWVEVPSFFLGASIFDVAMNKDWPEA